MKILSDSHTAAAVKSYYLAPEGALSLVESTLEKFNKLHAHRGLIAGAAAIGTAAWAWHRHREKAAAGNETVQQMPIESSEDYYRYRNSLNLQPAPARRAPDPLLTAGVVGNLDRNKINHSLMGSNKYNNLYSGVM